MTELTLSEMEILVARQVNFYESVITTKHGESDGKSLYSTSLARFKDHFLSDKWARITQSTTVLILQIKDNFGEEGKVTFYSAFGATIEDGATVEIFDYHPNDIDRAINESIEMCWPSLSSPVDDYGLIANSILINPSFEEWSQSTYPDNWTRSSGTLTAEATIKWCRGQTSLKCVGATNLYQSSNEHPEFLDMAGGTITFYAFGKSSVAADLSIRITAVDSSAVTTTDTATHSGGGGWEKLTASLALPSDLASVKFEILQSGAGSTGYIDNCFVPYSNYYNPLPSTMMQLYKVEVGNSWDSELDNYWNPVDFEPYYWNNQWHIRLTNTQASGNKLRLAGIGALGQFTSLTSTLNIPMEWKRPIIFGAVINLYNKLLANISANDSRELQVILTAYQKKFDEMKFIYQQVYFNPQTNKQLEFISE